MVCETRAFQNLGAKLVPSVHRKVGGKNITLFYLILQKAIKIAWVHRKKIWVYAFSYSIFLPFSREIF